MRKLIGGMKLSLDGKVAGPEGVADWVDGWSEDFGLTPQVDACLLGGGMYPTYEQYWTEIQNEPTKLHPFSGELPTQGEVEWARFAAQTPGNIRFQNGVIRLHGVQIDAESRAWQIDHMAHAGDNLILCP